MSVASETIMRLFWSALLLCFATFYEAKAALLPPDISIPFEYSEGLLWVQIEVPQSSRPLNFLFDTGAEISVINAATVAALGLFGGNKIKVRGVQTTTTGHWPVQ